MCLCVNDPAVFLKRTTKSSFWFLLEVGGDCPPELNDLQLYPEELVVQYGEPVFVTCHSPSNYTELGWGFPLGNVSRNVNQNITWKTESLTDWEIQLVCYMTLDDVQCNKTLPFTIYSEYPIHSWANTIYSSHSYDDLWPHFLPRSVWTHLFTDK